ncbi:MAG TPA: adenylate/guanylate cyclase domain-containing protein [Candidatus Limnocylindria bacterium]|jgi:PAS domain S-box-containing protein|nr:adenylate/guanylate cyclase domain-containing protein [Candidatus Limnocylindria bacterium]
MEGLSFALLQFNPSSVVVMDVDGHIRSLNANAQRLLATTEAQAVGRPYTEVFGPSLSQRVFSLVLKSAKSGDVRAIEATLPDGRRAKLRASAGPLRDAAGNVSGIVFVADEDTSSPKLEELAEREARLRGALKRYLGDTVAEMVDARPSFVDVGGQTQPVSVLHADVRGYTTIAEELAPEKVVSLLLRYHGAASKALREAGGCIDRFAGDAILALWNAPEPQTGHVRLALQGALALQAAAREAGTELGYGVGVHTGEAMVGNLGSGGYQNFTAIGDTINVAARLQGHAQAGEVICSAAVLEAAGSGVRATALGALELKGRRAPVEAFRVEGLA